MQLKDTFNRSLHSAKIILSLVIPIYIIAEILYYYNTLSYISFLVEPFTSILGLPAEASLSIISGMFLNLYAAIAFAAPLDMSIKEWSVLGVFLGIAHSLVVEGAILKKLNVSLKYSFFLRLIAGIVVGYFTSLLPDSFFHSTMVSNTFSKTEYSSLKELLIHSFYNATILAIKIVVLITILIVLMDFLKSFLTKNVSKPFIIIVGIILGITSGAGILIAESKNISKKDMFFIITFLMICHAVIEDTLLFVIFGADFWLIVGIRAVFGVLIAYLISYFFYKNIQK